MFALSAKPRIAMALLVRAIDFNYNQSMELIIDDELLQNIDITPEQARLDFAIGLYIDRKITLGQGARIASLTQGHFLRELGKRKVPVSYDVGEFRKDMQTLKKLNKA